MESGKMSKWFNQALLKYKHLVKVKETEAIQPKHLKRRKVSRFKDT